MADERPHATVHPFPRRARSRSIDNDDESWERDIADAEKASAERKKEPVERHMRVRLPDDTQEVLVAVDRIEAERYGERTRCYIHWKIVDGPYTAEILLQTLSTPIGGKKGGKLDPQHGIYKLLRAACPEVPPRRVPRASPGIEAEKGEAKARAKDKAEGKARRKGGFAPKLTEEERVAEGRRLRGYVGNYIRDCVFRARPRLVARNAAGDEIPEDERYSVIDRIIRREGGCPPILRSRP